MSTMTRIIISVTIISVVANSVSGFGPFDFDSHSNYHPKYLNHYQFKGLFKPHLGGSSVDEDSFSKGSKGLSGNQFVAQHGVAGEDIKHGDSGVYKGEGALKGLKGESEYYFDSDGVKKEHNDGKEYYGGHHFGNEAKSEDEKAIKQGHRKGHKVTGFSTSHHNDETGKTEEYYDEAHDEAGSEAFEGKSGGFGEAGKSAFKGEHHDGGFKGGEVKKGVHFDKGSGVHEVSKDEKHFGEAKFGGNDKAFSEHKVLDNGGLSEYSESDKYVRHHPEFYI
uniref:Uncharacterized protein LOC114338078 n=1 Tax=Diabrotica virgifera virgifera TaxID=50390 RepID=A0A6P7GH57_DIAVI